jgi:hypothetical protein
MKALQRRRITALDAVIKSHWLKGTFLRELSFPYDPNSHSSIEKAFGYLGIK